MFGDVNLHVANKYLGAPKVHYPDVDQKLEVLAVMNANPAPKKSSRFKGGCW